MISTVSAIEGKETPGLADVDRVMTGVSEDGQVAVLDKALEFDHRRGDVDVFVRGAARVMKDMHDEVRSDVMATVLSELGVYRNPLVGRATAAGDFRLSDLSEGNGNGPACPEMFSGRVGPEN